MSYESEGQPGESGSPEATEEEVFKKSECSLLSKSLMKKMRTEN